MAHDGVPHHRALARQHADHALGHTALFANARQRKRGQRGDLGRLDHDGVACCQRGRHFLGFTRDGRIPRRDGRHHAQRFVQAHGELRAALRGEPVFHGFASGGHELKGACCAVHQGARFGDGFAVVAPLQVGQLFTLCANGLGHSEQHGGTFMRFSCHPVGGLKSVVRTLDGLVGVLQAGRMKLGGHAAICRVDAGVGRATATAPLTCNVNLQVLHGDGNGLEGLEGLDEHDVR